MSYIGVNTEKLQDEIEKIKDIEGDFVKLSEIIKRDTDILKEYWQTDTSEDVYYNFDKYHVKLENVIDTLRKDIDFLEETAKQSYIEEDTGTSNLVDERVAVEGRYL